VISTVEVLIHAEQLMQERHSEPIRSRQIQCLAEAIVCKVNEEFARRFNIVAGKTTHNSRSPKRG
jgi:hypothetical protein